MRLFWQIIVLSALLYETGKERASAESNAAVDNVAQQPTPTSTKTVYGFLDFTTIVSDTLMIFKPSKIGVNKGRSVNRGQRTSSTLLNKPKEGINRPKIQASRPVLEASATVELNEDDEVRGRAGSVQGGGGRIKPSRPRPVPTEINIEGSLLNFEESSVQPPIRSKTVERLKLSLRPSSSVVIESSGSGSVISSYSLIKSHVDVSSRVDIRIGGLPKVSGSSNNKATPKPIEVRMEMNLSPAKPSTSPALPAGQSLVSKTVGTRIQNGMTTIHETSVIGTTIDGQYAHFVQSTSTVFQEPTAIPAAPGRPGSVEVVTDVPSVNALPVSGGKPAKSSVDSTKSIESNNDDQSRLASLPSLESLFESVNTPMNKRAENLPKPESLVVKKPTPSVLDRESSTAVVLKPTPPTKVSSTTTTVSSTLERRTGLASPSRLRESASRPNRNEEQRWRYNPTPKPKVAIQRTSGSNPGSRFRDRVPISSSTHSPSSRDESADYESDVPERQEPEPETPDPTEVITLRVQSVTPEGYSNLYYEVATIKSPYIMRLGAIRNTRFVTLTRSFTRLITPTPPPTSAPTTTDLYDEAGYDEPLPDPENILATTTPYENILKESNDTATLPAIIVAATEVNEDEYTLRTVTETFSTTELTMKTSILPYLRAGTTSHMTLTQSYYITRVVVAVKTIPPEDLYQFIPSKTLTDISTNLQEAGSEHNVRLLNGELEFSENDEYSDQDDEGNRHEKRVPAPIDLNNSELSSIGQDFDVSSVDKPSSHIELEPSLVDAAAETSTRTGTPPLPSTFQLEPSIGSNLQQQFPNQQDAPVLSPEQLQQLALFRFMNPYAAAGLPFGYPGLPGYGGAGANGGNQVITTSKPVVRTLDVIRTETVSIWDGAKTIYSTITRTKGTTVVTETEYGTATIAAPVNPLFPQQQFTVVSSPVVTEVTTTSTELRIYRIIFRAQTTYTTVTSTTVFPTMVTTYVSSTVPIQPTAFPGGLFPGSYPFAAFG
uniref:EOG090X017N n=1 Tax=Scapholeberis mucronata TaxID=202097 RepID=A0A4Y7NLH3_9CRUS|nr:EOG090X017N [Scapholeberis mucronata]SVE93454.1 EOG090X017N [Scapholeberis mucronata]